MKRSRRRDRERAAKRKKRPAKKQSVLESLIKAISAYYADDVLAPGVQLAYVAKNNEYYAAIHRYPKSPDWTPGAPAKRVVAFKFRADEFDEVIVGVAKVFEKAAMGAVRAQKILGDSLVGWREPEELGADWVDAPIWTNDPDEEEKW